MKNLFLLLVVALSLSACTKKTFDTPANPNSSDNEVVRYPQLIANKWQQTADTVQVVEDGKVTSSTAQGEAEVYYQFNADGTGQQINVLGSSNISYILNAKNIIITYPPAVGQTASVIMPGTIRVLNSTTLCMFFNDINVNGTSKSTQVIWFKKVG